MKPLIILITSIITTYSFAQHQTLEFKTLFSTPQDSSVACYRIPALITAPNGDLIAAIDERVPSCGDLKFNADINIVMKRSLDNGDTWSAIETIIDYPTGESASDPSMIVDATTEKIFLFYNYMDLINAKDIYNFKVISSTDNGKTWSSPKDITSQITSENWHQDFKFITSGRGIQTSQGYLLHTIVNLQKGAFLFGSKDHGSTWQLMSPPLEPGDESKVVEVQDGSWMVNSRVNNTDHRHVHISKDQGVTWTSFADTSLTDPSCNASIISCETANEKLLLFSNANHKTERKNLTIRMSHDNGYSWSTGMTIYNGSSAYSSMAILANGDVGLFFEKDDYQKNAFVRIPRAHFLKD